MIIGYITWGDRVEIYAESAFSILTFLPDSDVEEVCVITERPEYYAMFGDRVTIVPITEQMFREWHGQLTTECDNQMESKQAASRNYTYRSKNKGVEKLVELYPGKDVLFVDTDTFRGGSLRPIQEALTRGEYCLNELCGRIVRSKLRTTRELWRKLRGRTFAGYTVDETSEIWNSGTVGLPGATAREVSQKAAAICDELYEATGFYGAEEIGFSFALTHYGKVIDTVGTIGHYWTNKKPWDDMIAYFLAKCHLAGMSLEDQMAAALQVDFRAMPVGIHHPKRRKQILRLTDRYFPLKRAKYFPDKIPVW